MAGLPSTERQLRLTVILWSLWFRMKTLEMNLERGMDKEKG